VQRPGQQTRPESQQLLDQREELRLNVSVSVATVRHAPDIN
jgi:hypothetical protein